MTTKKTQTGWASTRSVTATGRVNSTNITPLAGKMAARNQEIRPVGAWVLPGHHCSHDAVSSARAEELRIRQMQQDKEARLKQFQEDVKRRVLAIDRLKRQQQLNRSQQAANAEGKILSQSGDKFAPRQDRCSVRREDDLSIQLPTCQTVLLHGSATDSQVPRIEQHREQVHKLHSLARQSLATCQIISGQYQSDDLPGGIWRNGATFDHPVSRKLDDNFSSLAGDPVVLDKENIESVQKQMVRFDIDKPGQTSREDRIAKKTVNVLCGTDVDRAPTVPVLRPDVETREERVRASQQLAMYRRLFMDIEREQIRENIRQRNHRMKMASLKKQKEEDRWRVEDGLSQPLVDPVTGLTFEQSQSIESVEQELSLHASQAAEDRQRKRRETERFLEALKRNLREKIEKQSLDVPQLCSCGPTIWDTNPDTCANNCIFYKNPKGYAKALQSVLSSCDI